ncbi:hypothetical protein CJF30_00009179 [Rutstroemia sp. NJR-2017a BBW]|nr:hypothetical protein CJF30_00009179 [Rutstroemia sp. NJR-2017a BBW]
MAQTTATTSSTLPIGVILCSSRKPRVCPQIAEWVTDTLQERSVETAPTVPRHQLSLIDLAAWNLPLFDEPGIPSQIKHHSEYAHEHTRAWSVEVQKYSGFIFILPQYNWGYPAVIKNAIDFLFHEWKGKAAMIVSYGGHGGTKAAGQLKQVLQGVGMVPCEKEVALTFEGRASMVKTQNGEPIAEVKKGGLWEPQKKDVKDAMVQMVVGERRRKHSIF